MKDDVTLVWEASLPSQWQPRWAPRPATEGQGWTLAVTPTLEGKGDLDCVAH